MNMRICEIVYMHMCKYVYICTCIYVYTDMYIESSWEGSLDYSLQQLMTQRHKLKAYHHLAFLALLWSRGGLYRLWFTFRAASAAASARRVLAFSAWGATASGVGSKPASLRGAGGDL
jgi:hypothetical protein